LYRQYKISFPLINERRMIDWFVSDFCRTFTVFDDVLQTFTHTLLFHTVCHIVCLDAIGPPSLILFAAVSFMLVLMIDFFLILLHTASTFTILIFFVFFFVFVFVLKLVLYWILSKVVIHFFSVKTIFLFNNYILLYNSCICIWICRIWIWILIRMIIFVFV